MQPVIWKALCILFGVLWVATGGALIYSQHQYEQGKSNLTLSVEMKKAYDSKIEQLIRTCKTFEEQTDGN